MKKRSPVAVFLLGLVTLGFYSWYWVVKTKGEMNKRGEKIPTAWIWLIPIIGPLWWYWKYSEGVEHTSQKQMNAILAFVLLFFLGMIGQAIIQSYFNKADVAPATTAGPPPTGQPAATPAPIQPAVAATTPPAPQPPTTTPPNPPIVSG